MRKQIMLWLLRTSQIAQAHMVADMQAKARMTKSTVVDNDTGKSVDSQVRTSTGTFYSRGEDEVRASPVPSPAPRGRIRAGGQRIPTSLNIKSDIAPNALS